MGIISRIDRRAPKTRILLAVFYILLCLGALSMLYPFALMISGSGCSNVDSAEVRLVPQYLYDDLMLYRKTVDGIFNEKIVNLQSVYDLNLINFQDLNIPLVNSDFNREWEQFLEENKFPFYYYISGFSETPVSRNSLPENFRKFKNSLFHKFNGDLSAFNLEENTEYSIWAELRINETPYLKRRIIPNTETKLMRDWFDYSQNIPLYQRPFIYATGFFHQHYLNSKYTRDISHYNKEHNTDYRDYSQIPFPPRFPQNGTPKEQADWEYFTRNLLNLFWIRLDNSAKDEFTKFLAARYANIEQLNEHYGTKYREFKQVLLSDELPCKGMIRSDFGRFISGWINPVDGKRYIAPVTALKIVSVEFLFREYLEKKYININTLNQKLGTNFRDFAAINPPQQSYQYEKIMENKSALRWEFATRNFVAVIDYILLQGRAIFNTALYCLLAIICALTINPIAAYALSRFKLPSTYKILLFLMLTMAFPQMVTQIPNFLMMREMRLLNTFGALILPTLANGYSIFLLKGFFDSLPKEVYESAMIDGAGEIRMFFQFTMNLSKPILAVLALNAFTQAYSNFMMALLLCQEPEMWTLMPWLYQLQSNSCQSIIYASLLVAAVPTFIIFFLCQNVIMRGIVVPVEK